MPKLRKNNRKNSTITYGPGQDVAVVKKQADQFPAIGMTLSSYGSGSAERPPAKPSLLSRFFRKLSFKRVALSIVCLALVVGILLGAKFIYNLHKAFGGNIFSIFHTAKLKGEDSGRVNILLAGDSSDDPGHQGADLTDSIMLISIDTKDNTGWMLSIPRDLWVEMPSGDYQKINAAYENGNSENFSASGYPNGGMGLLEQIVSRKLDIPIDYYALIDYTAFKDAVNAVGGITVDIQSPDPLGLYDAYTNLRLPNGEDSLNGQEALNLARARGDNSAGDISYGFPDGDFDRTTHQRQMLTALVAKITTTPVLANPLALNGLIDTLGSNVKSDLNLSDVRRLYALSKKIPQSKIQSLSLNNNNGVNLLKNYTSYGGQDSLIPASGINNYSAIQAFVARYTAVSTSSATQ